MAATFFVDENDLALGRALASAHDDVVYPGHPDLPEVPRSTPDDEWLRVIGTRQLVVITRDKRIRYRAAEKQAWIAHRVRGFVLTGTKSQSTRDSTSLIEHFWTQINHIVSDDPIGPWMRSITGDRIRRIELG